MMGAVVSTGLLIGVSFGAIGLLSGFCLLSSLRDWWAADDGRKVRSYATAVAVALIGTQIAVGAGLIDIGKSLYLQPSFSVPLIFMGGLLFGFGMVLSNGCASRALVLLGSGNLRSLVVLLVIGVTAQMALKGLLAPLRLVILQSTQIAPATVAVPGLFSQLGLDPLLARMAAVVLVAGALLTFAFSDPRYRRAYGQGAAGIAIGCLVVGGWMSTGWLAADEFDPVPVTSLTFISPVADTVQYAMLSTGMTMTFGNALVIGVVAGSFVTAALTGRLRLEGYHSPQHLVRSICGAALMGVGGAMAYGCSVGQGVTGMSTLAIPSFIAVAGILAGAAFGLRGKAAAVALSMR